MVLFSWFIHSEKSSAGNQPQDSPGHKKNVVQQNLSRAQQSMWPTAKPRVQAISTPLEPVKVSDGKRTSADKINRHIPQIE